MQRTTDTTNYGGTTARKGSTTMCSKYQAEVEARDFAREFPTPNVKRAIALCESGKLDWITVHELFRQSLTTGLKEVRS